MTDVVSPGPQDPKLWQLVKATALEIWSMILAYKGTGGYMPFRHDVPTVSMHPGKWPSVSRSFLGKAGFPKYSGLFHLKRGEGDKGYAYGDLDTLSSLISYVKSDANLAKFLVPPSMTLERYLSDDRLGRLFDDQVFGLPMELVSRHAALNLGDMNDQTMLPIYCELERYFIERKLPVDVLVPITLVSFDFDELDVTEGVVIRRLTEGEHAQRIPDYHVAPVPRPLIEAATHAFVFQGKSVQSDSYWWSAASYEERYPTNDIDAAFQALSICTGNASGYCQLLIAPRGWASTYMTSYDPLEDGTLVRRYPSSWDAYRWNDELKIETASQLQDMSGVLASLQTGTRKYKLAARRLQSASQRERPEDQVIDHCVGLESLLSDSKDEVSYRLAIRLAALMPLMDPRSDPARIQRLVKKIYDYRSHVAHGSEVPK